MKKTFEITLHGGETVRVRADYMSLDDQNNLTFEEDSDASVIAAFHGGSWVMVTESKAVENLRTASQKKKR